MAVVGKGGGRNVIRKFKPFERGMQVSCGIYPKMLEEGVVWEDTEVSGARVS